MVVADGEKWQLEDNIAQLMDHLNAVLDKTAGSFVVLNLYSMGFSALIANNLLQTYFKPTSIEFGELAFSDRAKRRLPLGILHALNISHKQRFCYLRNL